MALVGYKLIKIEDGSVIEQWGGIWGQCPGVPNPIDLPNGDIVCAPELNTNYSGYELIPWEMAPPSPTVPQQAPMWAVRTVLQNAGLFDQAQQLINASTDNALKNVWEYGNFADRNSSAINTLAEAMNLTNDQVDQMFIEASNITV